METLGQRIKRLRQGCKLTQWDLAQKLAGNYSPLGMVHKISGWERNRHIPRYHTLLALTSLFHVSIHYLLFGQESSSIIPKIPTHSFGKNIRDIRKDKKLTPVECGKLVFNTSSDKSASEMWSRVEHDYYKPSAQTLIRLSKLFDVSVDWLIGKIN